MSTETRSFGAPKECPARHPRRTTATKVAVACRVLYRGDRELLLQVGPEDSGGTTLCTLLVVVLEAGY